jgi:hypothetical protein
MVHIAHFEHYQSSFPRLTVQKKIGKRNEVRECIQKFPDWVDKEINNNNKHSLRRNTKGYGGKTH